MKKLFTLLILSFAYYSNAQVPSYIPSNGLVGYWPFNGNANDESGNGNHGTVNGPTLTVDRNGLSNKAYSFDGINDFIEVLSSSSVNFGLQSMSLHAWIKETGSNNNFNGLICKMDANGDGYQFVISNNKLQSEWGQTTTGFGSGLTGNVNLNDNSWHLVTMIIDRQANTLTFYNNNNIDNSINGSTISLANINNLANLWFGKERNSMYYFKGLIDDIIIYNRALSQQEINALYTGIPICATPTATITPQGNTTFCQGGFVTLNASTGTNYTYEWYKNGQLINGASSNTYQVTTSGSYTVKVIDGACSATSSQTSITVNPLPTAVITPQSSTTFCSGNSVLLNASTANGNTYEWYKNLVLIPSASSSSYSANQSGSYTVKIYNGTCNTTSSATNVTVNPSPTASINTSGTTTFCQGGFVTLTASGGGTYQWNNSSISASVNATTGGTYSVIVTNNGCTSTASQLVTVNPNPSVSLTSLASYINNHAPSIQLSGTPSGGTYSGPGVVGSNFNPSTAGLGVKNITYNYTNVNGCVGNASTSTLVYDTTGVVCTSYITVYDTISVTDTLYITTTLSLQNNASNTFKVYPNPAKDHITIDNGNYSLMNGYSIKIENVIGQTVFSSSINAASFYIDLSNWTGNGVYLLHIKNSQGNDVELRKIVLQH
jgi:hypothetical protein